MAFDNLDKPEGLATLNTHLQDKSYVNGFVPTSDDVTTFEAIKTQPEKKHLNAHRWWNHIASFSAEEKAAFGASTGAAAAAPAKKSDDDFDLFGEDDDEHEAEISRIAAENAKKKAEKLAAAGKKKEALKSAVVIDVKPWDDTTDMAELERLVRTIELDGLEWKAGKLTAIGYGIKKLQISAHIEDEKVSVDDIQEKIEAFEDFVQSTDIDTFTKL
ncbi:hypothetical protein PROFUN_12339 [Planoprotostelium fungivorum]|uniref:Translation elongation factor EF1B beta/delta subunit guanine nucleotide exchange domain-containing protein n=1 Tax=Planoprotostelium fungivorum TaxID=1890364 RepID=A0A2P6N9E4_9EUKA|nr:hypothetical protein PROFUN_12339 [Planoprotostelium fungivorum]